MRSAHNLYCFSGMSVSALCFTAYLERYLIQTSFKPSLIVPIVRDSLSLSSRYFWRCAWARIYTTETNATPWTTTAAAPPATPHGMHFPSGYFSKNYFDGSRVFIPPFFRLFSIFDKKNALFIDTTLTIFNDSLLYAYNIHTSALHLIYIVLSTYIQSLKIIDVICIHQ